MKKKMKNKPTRRSARKGKLGITGSFVGLLIIGAIAFTMGSGELDSHYGDSYSGQEGSYDGTYGDGGVSGNGAVSASEGRLTLMTSDGGEFSISEIPEYNDSPYAVVNDNVPYFTESDLTTTSYEYYSELDSLGRCGVTIACVGTDLMPTEKRGSISKIKPSGWHTVKYDCVDGKYLYNRCHLIGYQLTGENANKQNLITGTRYMNTEGMLPFENMVADYVKETENHVLYRVTPIFEGSNPLASGVEMEAWSVEDEGESICFNVYVYNVQPEIAIDYTTGESYYVGN